MHFKINRKIHIMSMIVFVFVLCNIDISFVYSGLWEGSTTTYPSTYGWGFGGGSRKYERVAIATGYRITVVQNNGKRVTGDNNIVNGKGYASISIDYWSDALLDAQKSCAMPGFYYLSSKCFFELKDNAGDKSIGTIPSHIRKTYKDDVISYHRKKPKTDRGTADKRLLGPLDSSDAESEWNKKNQFNFLDINAKCGSHKDCLSGANNDIYANNNYADHVAKYLDEIGVANPDGNHTDEAYKIVAAFLINSRALNYLKLKDNTNVSQIYNKLHSGFDFSSNQIPRISYSSIKVEHAKEIVAEALKRNFYILVEPVMAIQLADNNNNTNNPIMIGTASDLAHLDLLGKAQWGNEDYLMYSALHPIVYTKGTGTIAGINACQDLETSHETINQGKTKESNGCLGVYVFDLKSDFEELGNKCDEKAKKYISEYKSSDRSATAKSKYINKLAADDDTKDCVKFVMYGPEPKYETTYCNILDPNNIDLVLDSNKNSPGYSGHSTDVCTSYTCQEMANIVYNRYKNSGQIGVEDSDYEKRILNVKNEYDVKDRRGDKEYNELLTSLWQSQGLSGPTCDYLKVKSCPVNNIDAKCKSSGNSFTLSDTDDVSNCIKTGVAYNNLDESGNVKGGGNEISESSIDTIDGNGKCRETVSFTFPGDETGIKAGTVFTWGTGRSITGQPKAEIFGTMTVERTCYLNGKSSISMKWADNNINPKIALYYKEAIPNSVTSYTAKKINGTNLNVENIIKEINVYSDESGTQRIGGNNSGKTVNCGGNCNNAKRVDMKASYDIKYGTSFLWHYNRNINDTSLTLEKSDSENNYYTAIGYGLPTTFVTPTGLKGNYEFGSTITSNDGNGYMYVKVNNVGTCKNSASNECHFNKSLTFAVTDDNAADKTSIYYKCKFDIENELFGTEDGHDTAPNVPPKGLDVVFRTVQLINKHEYETGNPESIQKELNKAFPGRAGKIGNGRYSKGIVGTNWLTIDSNEANNTKRIFDILSNMVYSQQPAYHIVLDTTKINYIRKNNKTYRSIMLDPYTDNQRFKFDKTGANIYAYGASDFITVLINKNWLKGECASGDTDFRAKRGACRQS